MANVCPLKEGTILKGKLDYHITSQLGHGGFGITYLAEAYQTVDGIPQKLKFCIKEFFLSDKCSRSDSGWVNFNTDEKTVKNGKSDFKAEAEILKSLNEVPGIVPVKEVIETNNTVYYVMQFLEGQTLDKMIHAEHRLNESEALPIIEKVGNALSKLHEKKMTHLDVKPENIMLVKEFGNLQPVLIDFGLSRSYNMFGWESSGKKVFAISEGYSPVEQYGIITKFSPESDVYALAATLFHMLTGQLPKASKDVTEKYLSTVLNESEVSDRVKDAIIHAMQKDYSIRTHSVKQFLSELNNLSGDDPGCHTYGCITKPFDNGNTSDNKKKYFIIAAILVLSALVILFILSGGKQVEVVTPDGPGGPVLPIDTTKQEPPTPPVPMPATLTVDCTTPGADIYIDGVKKGSSSWTGKLDAGSYLVEARKSGYDTQKKSITLSENQTLNVNIPELTEKHKPDPAELKIGDYAVWRGGVKSGKPHGQGTMTFIKSHRIDSYCEDVANAGDKVTGTYVNGHLDNGTWQSPGKPDKFLLLGN